MTKTKNTNGELPETIIVHMLQLERLNKSAIEREYNRSIYYEDLYSVMDKEAKANPEKWTLCNGDTSYAVVILQPIMVHNHAQGLEVEPHYRCLISQPYMPFLMIDVSVEDYEEYKDINRRLKSRLGMDDILNKTNQSWAV